MAEIKNPPVPKMRNVTIEQLTRKMEGENMNKPEVCYVFSNGVQKVDTDRTNSGVYSGN